MSHIHVYLVRPAHLLPRGRKAVASRLTAEMFVENDDSREIYIYARPSWAG